MESGACKPKTISLHAHTLVAFHNTMQYRKYFVAIADKLSRPWLAKLRGDDVLGDLAGIAKTQGLHDDDLRAASRFLRGRRSGSGLDAGRGTMPSEGMCDYRERSIRVENGLTWRVLTVITPGKENEAR